MRRLTWALTAVALAAGAAALAQGLHERTARVKRRLAKEAQAHAALRGSPGTLPTDNSLCVLCHANFRDEELVTAHLKQGVTCAVCHGISFEHMNDETSRTKPDLLYGRAQVAGFCTRCHGRHTHPERVQAFLAEWKGKTRPNGRLILQQATCTDCHGLHAIPNAPILTGR
jgi:cytochrome c5